MEPTPANKHHVDVGNNPALSVLYGLGGVLLGAGLLILAIATGLASSISGPGDSPAWQALGGLATSAGGLLVTGGLVSHAINWQIGRIGM